MEIRNAFINSMLKWNETYFYETNALGIMTKHKVIDIIEGTVSDHNLVIYPTTMDSFYARTESVGSNQIIEVKDGISHEHFVNWKMHISLPGFKDLSPANRQVRYSRVGAHELGHVLSLRDLDVLENESIIDYHHEEALMGYAAYLSPLKYQTDITYKDLAGVAIVRGFHTDNDHLWLLDTQNADGTSKLRCSICNGIKNEVMLSNNMYNGNRVYNLGHCNNKHDFSSGNIIALGGTNDCDFLKCKYCFYMEKVNHGYVHNLELFKCLCIYCGKEELGHIFRIVKRTSYNHSWKCVCDNVIHNDYHNFVQELIHGEIRNRCTICGYTTTDSVIVPQSTTPLLSESRKLIDDMLN